VGSALGLVGAVLETALTPLVGLVGAVTGFYFAGRDRLAPAYVTFRCATPLSSTFGA
jgi:hypothetical protein